jgi:hypothetical protein
MRRLVPTLWILFAVNAAAAAGEPSGGGDGSGAGFERMTVVGSRAASQETTGAANYVSIEEIEVFQHTDLQRI